MLFINYVSLNKYYNWAKKRAITYATAALTDFTSQAIRVFKKAPKDCPDPTAALLGQRCCL